METKQIQQGLMALIKYVCDYCLVLAYIAIILLNKFLYNHSSAYGS